MCGRVIQSSAPFRHAIVEGPDVRDSRFHNHPPRWNGAPSQELLVIRRNHKMGELSFDPLRWGLIPYFCADTKGGRKPISAKCETVRTLPTFRESHRRKQILDSDPFTTCLAARWRTDAASASTISQACNIWSRLSAKSASQPQAPPPRKLLALKRPLMPKSKHQME
jgi:hypothetical protein